MDTTLREKCANPIIFVVEVAIAGKVSSEKGLASVWLMGLALLEGMTGCPLLPRSVLFFMGGPSLRAIKRMIECTEIASSHSLLQ